MQKAELEGLLVELDEALLQAFPGPEPIRVLVVGGASLLFANVTSRQTKDIDVIVTDFLGTGEASLVYNLTKTTRKMRTIIAAIGKRHGLRGNEKMFLNDDCAPFLRELGEIPSMRLYHAYRKLQVYLPTDLSYILACKLLAGRPTNDYEDIALLRRVLHVATREQAVQIVNRFFPDQVLQSVYGLPDTLDDIFRPNR